MLGNAISVELGNAISVELGNAISGEGTPWKVRCRKLPAPEVRCRNRARSRNRHWKRGGDTGDAPGSAGLGGIRRFRGGTAKCRCYDAKLAAFSPAMRPNV